MSLARRVARLAIVSLFSAALTHAQPTVEPGEGVANWSAPPFWTPSPASLEKVKEDGALPLGAEAIEGLPTSPLPFFGIRPCRIVDTRPLEGFTGTYGPPAMVANANRDFDLNSAAHCPGIPANAEAYSLNVTVTQTTALGDIRIWPTDNPPASPVSTQNWPAAGWTIANAAVVPAGTGGSITVQVAGSNAHLLIDINGYYAPIAIVNTVNGLSGNLTVAQGSNISVTPSGQTLTIANTAPAAWSLIGNAGTTPGTNFVGTTDDNALEFKVNNKRILRLEPHATGPNVIAGDAANFATAGVFAATVGGGGLPGLANRVTDDGGTVGGGYGNQAGDNAGSTSDRPASAVAGGIINNASGFAAFVGGGSVNVASGEKATVGGGSSNVASGLVATVPGGNSNIAAGSYSFAAGRRAWALHSGSFVWRDSQAPEIDIASTGVNQFIVRATGGIWLGMGGVPSLDIATNFLTTSTGGRLTIGGTWTNSSDVAAKEDFEPVDSGEVLARVATLPISRWSYKAEGDAVKHMGPTGQDFAAAFGLGSDDKSIATVDADGVALVAIQALYEIVKEKDRRIEELEARLTKLESKAD